MNVRGQMDAALSSDSEDEALEAWAGYRAPGAASTPRDRMKDAHYRKHRAKFSDGADDSSDDDDTKKEDRGPLTLAAPAERPVFELALFMQLLASDGNVTAEEDKAWEVRTDLSGQRYYWNSLTRAKIGEGAESREAEQHRAAVMIQAGARRQAAQQRYEERRRVARSVAEKQLEATRTVQQELQRQAYSSFAFGSPGSLTLSPVQRPAAASSGQTVAEAELTAMMARVSQLEKERSQTQQEQEASPDGAAAPGLLSQRLLPTQRKMHEGVPLGSGQLVHRPLSAMASSELIQFAEDEGIDDAVIDRAIDARDSRDALLKLMEAHLDDRRHTLGRLKVSELVNKCETAGVADRFLDEAQEKDSVTDIKDALVALLVAHGEKRAQTGVKGYTPNPPTQAQVFAQKKADAQALYQSQMLVAAQPQAGQMQQMEMTQGQAQLQQGQMQQGQMQQGRKSGRATSAASAAMVVQQMAMDPEQLHSAAGQQQFSMPPPSLQDSMTFPPPPPLHDAPSALGGVAALPPGLGGAAPLPPGLGTPPPSMDGGTVLQPLLPEYLEDDLPPPIDSPPRQGLQSIPKSKTSGAPGGPSGLLKSKKSGAPGPPGLPAAGNVAKAGNGGAAALVEAALEDEVLAAFNKYNTNSDGLLDLPELTLLLEDANYAVDADYIDGLAGMFGQWDADGSGGIELGEFRSLWVQLGLGEAFAAGGTSAASWYTIVGEAVEIYDGPWLMAGEGGGLVGTLAAGNLFSSICFIIYYCFS